MATLNIRNLPDEVHARLRVRAAKAGRSMEAEARAIIAAACAEEGGRMSPAELQAWVEQVYRGKTPKDAVQELSRERRRECSGAFA